MSRKITQNAVENFLLHKPFNGNNTQVVCHESGSRLVLFDNTIARLDTDNVLTISNCGWQSNTTKERLNALPNVYIVQKAGNWYLNGQLWDGNPTVIPTN